MKQCEKCQFMRPDFQFRDGNAICIICEGEMEVLGDGKIITDENIGGIMQERFQEREQ